MVPIDDIIKSKKSEIRSNGQKEKIHPNTARPKDKALFFKMQTIIRDESVDDFSELSSHNTDEKSGEISDEEVEKTPIPEKKEEGETNQESIPIGDANVNTEKQPPSPPPLSHEQNNSALPSPLKDLQICIQPPPIELQQQFAEDEQELIDISDSSALTMAIPVPKSFIERTRSPPSPNEDDRKLSRSMDYRQMRQEIDNCWKEPDVQQQSQQQVQPSSSWKRWLTFGMAGSSGAPSTPSSSSTPPSAVSSQQISQQSIPIPPDRPQNPPARIMKKSLRPTSDELLSLHLQEGRNEIKFLVTSRLQGTQEMTANIYLWNHMTRVVISDVDGTITKSDALGHILPMFGKDWSHAGIAKLYSSIAKNGYKILYLTSRSIIQAGATRDYISTLKQGEAVLPEGPIIMAPDRLFHCLAREVIMKQPEEFKIAALRDVKNLFGNNYNPFFAGFGNKLNVWNSLIVIILY